MHNDAQDTLLGNISFHDNLPVSWEPLSSLPSEGERLRYHQTNEELLQNLLLHDEQAASQDDDDLESVSGHEHFKRLEARLDLLLSLVTEMMTADGKLPPDQAVTISAHGLRVHTQESEAAGLDLEETGLLKIQLYLDPQFPRPLTLFAQLLDVQPQNFTVSFSPLEDRLQDLLDKYIFRQHRRVIALARRGENS